MANTRAKGNRNELKCVKELESEGWLVYRVKGTTKFNKTVDIFNLFDICAKKGNFTKWIQVKSNHTPSLIPYRKFAKNFCNVLETSEVWVYKDYHGIDKRVFRWDGMEKEE